MTDEHHVTLSCSFCTSTAWRCCSSWYDSSLRLYCACSSSKRRRNSTFCWASLGPARSREVRLTTASSASICTTEACYVQTSQSLQQSFSSHSRHHVHSVSLSQSVAVYAIFFLYRQIHSQSTSCHVPATLLSSRLHCGNARRTGRRSSLPIVRLV